jgi:hypothetical protein
MPELEAQLRRYGVHLDERYPDVTVAEIVADPRRAPALDDLRAAVPPNGVEDPLSEDVEHDGVRPTPLRQQRWVPPAWLQAAAAAAIALGLAGGVALLVRSTDSGPSVAFAPPSTGSVELTWAMVTGGADDLPSDAPVKTQDGYVAIDSNGLWRSTDGLAWDREPLPVDVVADAWGYPQLGNLDSWGYWLLPGPDYPIWRSRDAVTWEQVYLGPEALPDLSGVSWASRPGGMTATDSTLIHHVQVFGEVRWDAILGLSSADGSPLVPIWDRRTEIITFFDFPRVGGCRLPQGPDDGDEPCPMVARIALSVVEEGDRLRIDATDNATGELIQSFVGSVPDVASDELLAGLATGSVGLEMLAVSNDGRGFEVVSTAWGSWSPMVAFEGEFLAYGTTRDPGTSADGPVLVDVETWSSSDGRTWIPRGAPAFADTGSLELFYVVERGGVLLAQVGSRAEDAAFGLTWTLWRSEDGLKWSRVSSAPSPKEAVAALRAADFGWLYLFEELTEENGFLGEEGGVPSFGPIYECRLWFSDDGITWSELDVPAVPTATEPGGGGSCRFGAAGDTLWYLVEDRESTPSITWWVGKPRPSS